MEALEEEGVALYDGLPAIDLYGRGVLRSEVPVFEPACVCSCGKRGEADGAVQGSQNGNYEADPGSDWR